MTIHKAVAILCGALMLGSVGGARAHCDASYQSQAVAQASQSSHEGMHHGSDAPAQHKGHDNSDKSCSDDSSACCIIVHGCSVSIAASIQSYVLEHVSGEHAHAAPRPTVSAISIAVDTPPPRG